MDRNFHAIVYSCQKDASEREPEVRGKEPVNERPIKCKPVRYRRKAIMRVEGEEKDKMNE